MIYIQSNIERKLPHHFDCSCALFGAIDLGLDYRLSSLEDVKSGKFDRLIRKNLFVGSVDFMKEVFSRVGIIDVRLPLNSNRKSEIINLSDAIKRSKLGEKLFIKPLEIKLFSGFIIDQSTYQCIQSLPGTTKIICYTPFPSKILSEWRIYIHRDKIMDSRNYSGDFMIHPDYEYARIVLNDNMDRFPKAYTIDVAILEEGENVVVEFNDMWAIGNYGIPNDIYLNLLKERYFQIMED